MCISNIVLHAAGHRLGFYEYPLLLWKSQVLLSAPVCQFTFTVPEDSMHFDLFGLLACLSSCTHMIYTHILRHAHKIKQIHMNLTFKKILVFTEVVFEVKFSNLIPIVFF